MDKTINYETEIVFTSLIDVIKLKLIMNNITTIGELLCFSVMELLNFDNIGFFTIACIKKYLNYYGFHLIGEELIEYSDFYDKERAVLYNQCNVLIKKRNKIHGKKEFQAEEIVLCQQIFEIFKQIKLLRKMQINLVKEEQSQTIS